MAWYVDAHGALDVAGLIAAFQAFFREHSEHWVQRFEQYHEAGPQLLLQAHLQRVVNGGGRIEREYALGRGRTDLLIVWPQGGRERRYVVECKVRRGAVHADHRTHAGTANATRPRRRHPLTDPAISPRTKYRCSEKKTTNGITMVTNAPEVSTCQSCPREPTNSARRVVTSA